jgi:hypothetical protein
LIHNFVFPVNRMSSKRD